MNSFSRIIQITDLHITAEGESTKNGIDTLERASLIFKTLRNEKHDLLIISGDICYSLGNKHTYLWLKEQLKGWKVPVQLIGGNHDDLSIMNEVFSDFPNYSDEEAFTFSLKGKALLFLETDNGVVSEKAIQLFRELITHDSKPSAIIHAPSSIFK